MKECRVALTVTNKSDPATVRAKILDERGFLAPAYLNLNDESPVAQPFVVPKQFYVQGLPEERKLKLTIYWVAADNKERAFDEEVIIPACTPENKKGKK